ncbi:MAG: 3-deoxy-D-manno-octulosonic acid kinase [Fulvimonas sp.]|nr:3-deoxy-D-manno-octulosonic acid kinase [Fulvimonas sp.]
MAGMMQETRRAGTDGALLCIADAPVPIDERWFDADAWRVRGALHEEIGGRGRIAMLDTPLGPCVWRHYRRGGRIAVLLGDRYLWTGEARTRSFAEFRLLLALARRDLPAPRPVAARYRRVGACFYDADLITRRIENARTLAQCLAAGAFDAELAGAVGALVARFHRAGVEHADLNAHNVLVTPGQLYLIDFDRGRLRKPARHWRMANLRRLYRSLRKLGAGADDPERFERTLWTVLLEAYARTFAG